MSSLLESNEPIASEHLTPPSEPAQAVTVVLRAAGERTVKACRTILAQQVPDANITTICETPFARAVQRTFEIGVDAGRPWTLAIDADVMLRHDAVATLLAWGNSAADHVFEVQGTVLDKLMGGPRAAGNHLFRTALLPAALAYIGTDAAAESLRPETFVMRRMAEAGHPWVQHEGVLGLHDYEQAYRDIYRTAFVHAHKHNRQLPYLLALWERLAPADADYRVALWGARDGEKYQDDVRIDARQFSHALVENRLRDAGLREKDALTHAELDGLAAPAQIIDTFDPPPEYWLWQYLGKVSGPSLPVRLQQLSEYIPWPTIFAWLLRGGMRRLRNRFQKE